MLTLLLVLAAAPGGAVTLSAPDPNGCAWPTLNGAPLQDGPRGFCVRQVLEVPLERGERNVVLLVDAPHRFNAKVLPRVFVYRLRGTRLMPRFLGSGFGAAVVDKLAANGSALRVHLKGGAAVDCKFDGFPLVCVEAAP